MSREAIRQLIQQRQLTGTPEEIAAALNAKTESIPNSELITSTGLILKIGPDLARQALAGFKLAADADPLLQSQWVKFNTTGIDLSHPMAQQMIQQLTAQGVFSAEVSAALQNISVIQKSPVEMLLGDGVTVTADDVSAAIEPPVITNKRLILNLVATSDGRVTGSAVLQEATDRAVVNSYMRDDIVNSIITNIRDTVLAYVRGDQ
jgi:hypothetical protein